MICELKAGFTTKKLAFFLFFLSFSSIVPIEFQDA